MARKVSLINMKGGVGKSTLAVNLAWQFAGLRKWDKKVLVVDLDPQFNASQYLIGVRKYEQIVTNNIPTVWDVFEQLTHTPGKGKPKPLDPKSVLYNVVSYPDGSRIDLIPSRLELAYSLRNPGQKESLLSRLISKIEEHYNLILLDCAPTESVLTTAAYLASDWILVPVKPEYLSTIGLPLLVRSMEEFKEGPYEDHDLELAGIVFNHASGYVPEEIKSKSEVKSIAAKYGWYVFEAEVSYSRSYPKGAREGRPIFRTSYARSYQAGRFHAFANEFAQRIGL
ncbi:MAG: ParA family protein [Candidatus Bathyarchaeota archaeon]|nr:ParA family protein [Candidatus Bathyarchaeota archaeon]